MEIFRKAKKINDVRKTQGFKGVFRRFYWFYRHLKELANYQKWIRIHEITDFKRKKLKREIESFSHTPKISIVLPVYDVNEKWLLLCIDSVKNQIYENWELCIVDDCSPSPHIRRVLEEYSNKDERIKVVFRAENGHISAASNSALEIATGEYCVLLDHDDELSEDALFYVAKEVNDYPETEMIFSDEDLISVKGKRFEPKFKPDFSRDLFYSLNLITHLSCYKTEVLRKIGGFRLGFEGSQDYDLALRVIEQIPENHIRHIPKILYHWRVIKGSVAYSGDEKPYAHDAARRAIAEHLKRCGKKATVEPTIHNLHRVRYELPPELPKVSLITIADKDTEFTLRSIETFANETDYENLEILVIYPENQLNEFETAKEKAETRLLRSVFFASSISTNPSKAEMNNFGASKATGEILCFVDPNLNPLEKDWLRELVSFAIQKETGAVGAKLLYKNETILHGGLVIGINDSVGISHHKLPIEKDGNMVRAQVAGNFSAVSVSCMAIRRSIFEEFGGFDAESFPNKFFDVDLCLKMVEKGLRNVFTPYSVLSQINQGKALNVQKKANESENNNLRERWANFIENDPFFNPNLSKKREDFSIDVDY